MAIEIDRKISLGSIVSALTILVSVIYASATIAGDTETVKRDTLANSTRIGTVENALAALQREINQERVSQTRILTEVQTDLRYLRAALDDLRGQ